MVSKEFLIIHWYYNFINAISILIESNDPRSNISFLANAIPILIESKYNDEKQIMLKGAGNHIYSSVPTFIKISIQTNVYIIFAGK